MPTFRIREAADLLGVSDDTVRRWVEAGSIASSQDDAGRKVVDGASLAEFARTHAASTADPSGVGRSARNRFVGLVTRVVSDTVMAQVEMQCGGHRVVSLMSSEAVTELGLEPGVVAVAVIKATTVVVETPWRKLVMRSRTLALVAAAASSALVLAGCGSSSDSGAAATTAGATTSAAAGSTAAATLDGDITVFAAASLKATFTTLGTEFEAAHPGVKVAFSFAGSSDLVTQIDAGAPADVFASADTKNMDKVTTAGDATGTPVNFATNVLEIATPPGNPAGITSFADLAKSGVKVVVCAAQVPCGAAAATVEAATGTSITPVSEESSVTDVLAKVTSGEADAGLVYVTDVTTAGSKVVGVPFPESSKAVNTYPIVALKDAKAPATAAAFTAFVAGAEGQKVLAAAGFGKP